MKNFKLKIGLENHIRLNTALKLFCSCSNDSRGVENTNTCVYCIACPGTLPVVNIEAVKMCLTLCHNLNAVICDKIAFDRKHYEYPDLPKGYQITQNTLPCGRNAAIQIMGKTIRIERISLEEDAAKIIDNDHIRKIDFNRCGSPLAEVTTAPDFSTIAEVMAYLKILRSICEDLRIIDPQLSDCIRCDVNISVSDGHISSARAEIKNVNSLSDIKQCIEYEFNRITKLMMQGQQTKCETRFWQNDKSLSGRDKTAYLFIPEMDVPIFPVPLFNMAKCWLANNIFSLSNQLSIMPENLIPYVFSKYLLIARTIDLNQVIIADHRDIEILFTLCKHDAKSAISLFNNHLALFRKLSVTDIIDRISRNDFTDIRVPEKQEIASLVDEIMVKFNIQENMCRSDLQRFLMSKLNSVLKSCDMSVVFKNLIEILNERNN